jgi:lysophospholipase L1-like esterase
MRNRVGRGLGQADHVHLTRAGYARPGDMFYQDIITSYSNADG